MPFKPILEALGTVVMGFNMSLQAYEILYDILHY